jgi:hypothetical protein
LANSFREVETHIAIRFPSESSLDEVATEKIICYKSPDSSLILAELIQTGKGAEHSENNKFMVSM